MGALTSSLNPNLDSFGADPEIVEVSLLLPKWQIDAMENAAHQRGMNLGQMLRRMIGATFAVPVSVGG
jgi:hypothetical protein